YEAREGEKPRTLLTGGTSWHELPWMTSSRRRPNGGRSRSRSPRTSRSKSTGSSRSAARHRTNSALSITSPSGACSRAWTGRAARPTRAPAMAASDESALDLVDVRLRVSVLDTLLGADRHVTSYEDVDEAVEDAVIELD